MRYLRRPFLLLFPLLLLTFFLIAPTAKAACAWLNTCNQIYHLETISGGCSAPGIAPNASSKCCCDGANVTAALVNATNMSSCSWQPALLGKPCGSLPTSAVTQADSFCSGSQKTDVNASCCCLPKDALIVAKPAAVLNNPFDNLNIEIPGLYKSLGCIYNQKTKKYECPKVNCEEGDNGAASCNVPWIGQYIIAIYNYALIVIGSIAAVTIMMGGLLWLISGSNASRMKVAKEMIVGSISGLVIMFSSYMIISVVNPSILIFKPLSIGYIEPYPPDEPMSTGEVNEPSVFDDACKIYQKTKSTKACQDLVGKEPANLSNLFGGSQKRLNADFAQKVKVALKCVKDKNGGKDMFYVSAGVRTAQVSMDLYNTYIKDPKNANQAAQPCCSRHMTGNAVDLQRTSSEINWFNPKLPKEKKAKFIAEQWAYVKSVGLVDCMKQAGIPGGFVDSEPWHWSTSGH